MNQYTGNVGRFLPGKAEQDYPPSVLFHPDQGFCQRIID